MTEYMNGQLRLEVNLDINDRLSKEKIADIIKRAIEHGIAATSYGIKVQSVLVVK